ncbi:Hexokinase [Neolecta irregularis DAH-3]|uniref:Phosphotransferase n=1 Tax=Neolecta irregularis (strain DAH-3) TaxID=1198029 RepID=A0A1U7LJ08_NEOID|nr:Hexokinase [Neolecta irregularis DAH-3]|eukprot:OLL22629.1 Hexokinase [Neolecta irregularis DAH-3]
MYFIISIFVKDVIRLFLVYNHFSFQFSVFIMHRKPPSRKGSMNNVPRDLMDQISALEALFTIDKDKLNFICDMFVKALDKGLSVEGGDIPMIPTWVFGFPKGDENGGTNLRVCEVELLGNRRYDIVQSQYRIEEECKSGTSEQLFDFVSDCLKKFLDDNYEQGLRGKKLPLGFTFSYPCHQKRIDHGVLQRWTKGFDVKGVEGVDVVPMLEAALERKGVPIKVTALINDTTGTLIATNYIDPMTKIAVIFGTGCNAAYMEKAGCIPKLLCLNLPQDTPMAINCEWGAFDNEHRALPRTNYDAIIDKESPRPGQQSFEKMIAGHYLGEILRLVIIDLAEQKLIFEDQNISKIGKPYSIGTAVLSEIELHVVVHTIFETRYGIVCTEPERKLIRRVTELIGIRSARLSATGIAAICRKKGIKECHVASDGSVFNKYPYFKERGVEALRDLFGKEGDKITLMGAEDGPGVGAALIAALTINRKKAGILEEF